jgi:hypothetical protein
MSKVAIGLCAFVMLVITPSVYADPLVITSGSLSVTNTVRANYNLVGQNFSFTGGNGDEGSSPAASCHPCGSDNLLNLSSFFVGTSLGSGSATLNGTTFNNVNFLGQFTLSAASVALSGTSDITITVPFTFGGEIRGCSDSALFCLNEVFSTQQLTGQGLATLQLTFSGTLPSGVTFYDFKSLTYNFTSSEVPEPMTITLLTAGLIGLGAKLKTRTRRRLQG